MGKKESFMKRASFLLLFILPIWISPSSSLAQRKPQPASPRTAPERNQKGGRFKVRFISPPTLPKAPGYSHVVEVLSGRTIYISGQVASDRSNNVRGRGDFRAQTQQVFENIKAALDSVGASFKDVVKPSVYVVDISQLQAFREVRDKYVNTENPPASILVEVSRLVRDEFLIEIDAVAVLPK
jgi:enamine deaminase RidA (YjgF/YER057c/UK114 family)